MELKFYFTFFFVFVFLLVGCSGGDGVNDVALDDSELVHDVADLGEEKEVVGLIDGEYTNVLDDERMLIVISAPPYNMDYYGGVYEEIIAFDVAYAKSVMGKDNIVVLGDDYALGLLEKELPSDVLLEAEMGDIWMRDFTTVNPSSLVQFAYTPAAQGGDSESAAFVQERFSEFASRLGVGFVKSSLLSDGGNVVDNYGGKFILTEQFLVDNSLLVSEGVDALKELFGEEYGSDFGVAFIPTDGTSLGHADGMVMFVDENTIVMGEQEGELGEEIKRVLEESFSGVEVVEVGVDYEDNSYDENFESSCGINVNSVLTKKHLYVPHFGRASDDALVAELGGYTDREIVSVDASGVCALGGSVRCLSWQLIGENAEKIILAARGE